MIDSDCGVDDFLAIVAAARLWGSGLAGVTTCGGNVGIDKAIRNAMIALIAGRGALARKVSIAEGAAVASDGAEFPTVGITFHSAEGLTLPSPLLDRISEGLQSAGKVMSSYELMKRAQLTHPAILVCIGPLTNLAILCDQYPEALHRFDRVIAMAGVFSGEGSVSVLVDGRVQRIAEFNAYCDPLALRACMRHLGPRLWLLPKETCDGVCIEPDEIARLSKGSRLEHLLIGEWLSFRRRQIGKQCTLGLNDALAVLIAAGAVSPTAALLPVTVDAQTGPRRGETRIGGPGAHYVHVFRDVPSDVARTALLHLLFDAEIGIDGEGARA